MKRNFGILTLLAVILMMATLGCERANQQMIPVVPGESDEMMPMGPADDEESTVQLTLNDTYDNIRNGAHLIMAYDPASKSFVGTVTNTTNAILSQVRVEIHLFDSKAGVTTAELGPTTPKDLAPGETQDIVLMEEGPPFDMWTAHPEVGPMSGGGGEGGGEHGGAGGEGAEGTGEGAGAEGAEGGGEHGGGAGAEGAEGGGN